MQYDPNGSTDANDHWISAVVWGGGKYDWDGQWDLQVQVGEFDPNFRWSEGTSGVGVFDDGGRRGNGYFDNLECRWGVFTNVSRTLTVKMKDCCQLGLDPNLAHPDGGDKRQYTNGTAIVLDTVVPCGNKAFNKWVVKGPNQPGDPLYQEVKDTNAVLYLTMDGDYWVKAVCKCGGGPAPFAAMVLLVLALGVLVRRLT